MKNRKRGIAVGAYRLDGGRRWNAAKDIDESEASKARERMLKRENNSMMDDIVNDYMGGSDAAAKQAKAYENLLQELKAGGKHHEQAGSAAEAARARMIERDNKKHPDIGRDRANRYAYPAIND